MSVDKAKPKKLTDLRKLAEDTLQVQTYAFQEQQDKDIQSLIHELQVHQIKLEMQNEELKRAQEELEELRNRYSDLYDFAPIGYFTFNSNGLILEVNLIGARRLGVNRYSLIKVPFSLYVVEEDRMIFYSHLREVFSMGTGQICELKLKDKNGNQFDVRLESLAFQDSEGKFSQCKTVVSDISEYKQAEEALRESKISYRELTESIDEIFYAMDRDLRYTYWNKASENLIGISAKNAIGKSLYELFPDIRGTRAEKLYTEVLKTRKHQRFVSKFQLRGENLFFEINAYPTKTGSIFIAKDITEHRCTEELIREQAELLDKARDAIGVRDLEHRIIYWNKGAQRLYGWTKEEVMGKNADELLYKDGGNSPKLIEAKKSVIEKGEWVGELYQTTKSGKEITVDGHWTLIYDGEGKPKSILIINTDITQKKRLEAQLLRAQRTESIGTLAGGIAHDLNNMLTPIMLSLQVLKEKFKDEQSQALLNILENNTRRGANLVKQVLSFSRGVEGERRVLRIADVISEVDKIIEETFPKYIEIQINTPRDLWAISGDAIQLHQVLMNLCVNARDSMSYGGALKISAENFLIDENYARMNTEAKAGPYVVISVLDTGTGIPPEVIDKIFEPFFTTKERGKGTGLGLSIALGIVKSHGGFITVDSKVGKGTTFMVYLPAVQAERPEVEMQQLELSTGHGELILVVEDEDSIRRVTCSALEANGYQVLTANNGAEAVILYAQNRDKIKVVLMDLMMPVMDGKESIRVIRRVSSEVKIITVSGLAEKEELEKVTENSVQAFLPKPYTAEKLLRTIRDVLSK